MSQAPPPPFGNPPPQPAPDGPNDHAHKPSEHNSSAHKPVLRRTLSRPAIAPDPIDAAYITNRLTTLTHDLANLLDGSLRTIALARRSLAPPSDPAGIAPQSDSASNPLHNANALRNPAPTHAAPHPGLAPLQLAADPELLARQLATLHTAMQHMAILVKQSMLSLSGNTDSQMTLNAPFGATSSLVEAIHHAADVMRPVADEHHISIDVEAPDTLHSTPAGPVYTVLVSALRNAVESLQAADTRSTDPALAGLITIRAYFDPNAVVRTVVIEVCDNGVGPPSFRDDQADSVFRLGFSTKRGGCGIGLAVCLNVIHQLGGSIQLLGRPRDPRTGRGGAILRVCYPAPPTPPALDQRIGGVSA